MWFHTFLAASSSAPISESQATYLIYGVIGVLFLGGISSLKAILDIVRFFRGDPPGDLRYASKADLAEALKEIEAVEARTTKALEETSKNLREIFGEMRSIHRSLGRIEGNTKHDG
jgi:hypothetical protein